MASYAGYWHADNPWKDDVVYVPLPDLAQAIAGGVIQLRDGSIVPYDADFILDGWREHARADGYILQQPDGHHSVGVRYGPNPEDYHSPHNRNPELIQALLEMYRG